MQSEAVVSFGSPLGRPSRVIYGSQSRHIRVVVELKHPTQRRGTGMKLYVDHDEHGDGDDGT